MPSRRLDDQIRRLSARVVDAPNEELPSVLEELLAAIHEKMERLRGLAVNQFLSGRHFMERRSTPS
jgi:hypothetical protein